MRRLIRAVPILLAGIAVFLVLRWIPSQPEVDAGYLAYRVPVGCPLTFRVDPGAGQVAATFHLAAGGFDRSTSFRFPVTTTLLAGDGATLWTGRALIESPAGGAVANDDEPLTSGRVMSLPQTPAAKGARLRVVVEPGGDVTDTMHAVIRLAPRRAAIEDDAPGARRCADRTRLVQVRPLPRAPDIPPPLDAPGEAIAPDRAAAWTVRGPGRVRLAVWPTDGSAAVELGTVDNQGRSTGFTLLARAAPSGEPESWSAAAPPGGAITVSARCAGAGAAPPPAPCARVRAFVEDGALPLGDSVAPDTAGEIRPDRRRLPVWRLAAGEPPLQATLAGDGSARIVARPADGEATLAWRLVHAGRAVADGQLIVPYEPAPFERTADDLPAGEPIPFFASAPPGAVLELRSVAGAADVTLEALDDPSALRLAPAYEVPLTHARLRHAPYLRRHWVPFRPDDQARLASLGRAVHVEGQVRLEPNGPADGDGPYVAIAPLAPRTRQLLAEPLDDAPPRWRSFHRAVFADGQSTALIIPASGDRAGRVALEYRVPPDALGGALRVWLDGALRAERRLNVTRGRLRLEGLPAGRHEVRVEGAPAMIFTATPTADRTPWAERVVWRLERGESLTVPVRSGHAGKTLHVVLYFNEAAAVAANEAAAEAATEVAAEPTDAAPPRATVVIDGGAGGESMLRRAGGRTRLTRRVSPAPLPIDGIWLDREGGPRSRAHFAVRLTPDLGPGAHRVRITLDEGPRRVFARFYVTGAGAAPTVERLGAEWDLD